MSYNLSEELVEDILRFNVAAYSLSILVVLVPTFVLILVSIVAIVMSRNVQWKMKTLMLYVVVPEAMTALNLIIRGFNHILYFQGIEPDGFCRGIAYTYAICFDFKVFATFSYSLCVYVVLKYGLLKLKWKVLITMLVVPLVFILLVNLTVLFDKSLDSMELGHCFAGDTSSSLTAQYVIKVVLIGVLTVLTVTFSVLSLCYVRKNTINNEQIQKGMVKSLVLFMASSFAQISVLVVTAVYFFFLNGMNVLNVWGIEISRVTLYAPGNLPLLIPSIAIMSFVKPIRETLKSFCTFCRKKE